MVVLPHPPCFWGIISYGSGSRVQTGKGLQWVWVLDVCGYSGRCGSDAVMRAFYLAAKIYEGGSIVLRTQSLSMRPHARFFSLDSPCISH